MQDINQSEIINTLASKLENFAPSELPEIITIIRNNEKLMKALFEAKADPDVTKIINEMHAKKSSHPNEIGVIALALGYNVTLSPDFGSIMKKALGVAIETNDTWLFQKCCNVKGFDSPFEMIANGEAPLVIMKSYIDGNIKNDSSADLPEFATIIAVNLVNQKNDPEMYAKLKYLCNELGANKGAVFAKAIENNNDSAKECIESLQRLDYFKYGTPVVASVVGGLAAGGAAYGATTAIGACILAQALAPIVVAIVSAIIIGAILKHCENLERKHAENLESSLAR